MLSHAQYVAIMDKVTRRCKDPPAAPELDEETRLKQENAARVSYHQSARPLCSVVALCRATVVARNLEIHYVTINGVYA